ncbi:MAG: hypothetical protein V1888_01740 [archaeon]
MNDIEKFSEDFFKNLKCDVKWDHGVLVVNGVPKGFEDLIGKKAPYRLSFVFGVEGSEFVGKGSLMLDAMRKFLKGSGNLSILKIDFNVDAEAEILKRLSLRNCEIGSLTRSYRNGFFSRFSFVTSFNYLNESERVLSEVYVHEGRVVAGDLDGYTVVEGEKLRVDSERVKKDYGVAREALGEMLRGKSEEISGILKEKVEVEVARIRGHYDKQLGELGGDLNGKLARIREVELELRSCGEEERKGLRNKLDKMRKGLVKVGDDEVVGRVEREREMTIRDAMQKFSLNVDRKLVNTTVIYYPVYMFKLHLKSGAGAERLLDMSYDPLTRALSDLKCEGCGADILKISLCAGGHVSCGECLDVCGECGERFCVKCLKRSCSSCGRKLCKNCVRVCLKCGKSSCSTHMRTDSVSGEERCVSCLRACLRCHGMCEERFFGVALDGSKVCLKCLGIERRDGVLGRVFG